jgi:hypothetical protein
MILRLTNRFSSSGLSTEAQFPVPLNFFLAHRNLDRAQVLSYSSFLDVLDSRSHKSKPGIPFSLSCCCPVTAFVIKPVRRVSNLRVCPHAHRVSPMAGRSALLLPETQVHPVLRTPSSSFRFSPILQLGVLAFVALPAEKLIHAAVPFRSSSSCRATLWIR